MQLLLIMPDFGDAAVWLSLLTLTFLELVLGVDNIIFISIVADKLPQQQQRKARNMGLIMAMAFRIVLLFAITWVVQLVNPVFTIPFLKEADGSDMGISWKDIILILGGIFLIIKSTLELHHKLERAATPQRQRKYSAFSAVLTQIVLVDIIFSFDSILTAVGLVDNVVIMIVAVVLSMSAMLAFAGYITRFIGKHPTLQVLALAFLIVIGIMLIAQGLGQSINKAFIYTPVAFSLLVEILNMRLRRNREKALQKEQEADKSGLQ
jgi:predicted tellurium resistance membrane protein TerC